jgi:hypothetical protein
LLQIFPNLEIFEFQTIWYFYEMAKLDRADFPVCVKIGWLALGFLNLGFDRFQPRLVGVGMGGVKGIETICALFYGF